MSVGAKTQLGVPYQGTDGKWYVRAITHAALTEGYPYLIVPSYDSDGNQSAVTAACTAVASVFRLTGWATNAAAISTEAILCVAGQFEAYVDGTTDVAAGDFLKLAPGSSAVNLVYEGTTETNSSLAVACEARTTNSAARITVNLIGGKHIVNT
jgi:hypothetical protein